MSCCENNANTHTLTPSANLCFSFTPPLLSGWEAVWDKTHSAFYYVNLNTNETTWVLPDPPPTPADTKPTRPSVSDSADPTAGTVPGTGPKAADQDAAIAGGDGEKSRKRSRRRDPSGERDAKSERASSSTDGNWARDKKATPEAGGDTEGDAPAAATSEKRTAAREDAGAAAATPRRTSTREKKPLPR